ncbi:hypothetical protein PENARI_c001G06380 [Penicillium arizonense]|uniref:Uncharacterized protein n=1 Tax=Penicillium arizonense TaxID=1835702 RepID=A0A1F5LY41_PENAI|nr:hypothetical protein PENARI_c001G06380 [Penicillium arizonense]OGE58090.1 hypothetical protein PENARI_c001G06380 [Penicillium arizonense]
MTESSFLPTEGFGHIQEAALVAHRRFDKCKFDQPRGRSRNSAVPRHIWTCVDDIDRTPGRFAAFLKAED